MSHVVPHMVYTQLLLSRTTIFAIFSQPHLGLSNGQAIGMVVVRPSVTDVLSLSFRS